jgi:uncharacterized protein
MDTNTPGIDPMSAVLPAGKATAVEYSSTPRPVSAAERIQTIDVIRGVALLGILMMNIPGFGISQSVYLTILNGSHSSADYKTLAAVETFFSGTMRGLFSMLFGAGMILFTQNKKESTGGITVAEYYYRRLLWLVFFGLINAYVLLWPGDILYFYGLCGMILFPFRKISPKWLFVLGFVCIAAGALKTVLWYNEVSTKRAAYREAVVAEKANKKLTDEQQQAKTTWLEVEKNQKPDSTATAEEIQKIRSGYGTILTYFIPLNAGVETWGMYHGLWDMLCMMFIGMALFKWGFFSNKVSASVYSMALLLGYGIGIPIGWIYFDSGMTGFFMNLGTYVDAYRVPHWVLGDIRRLFLCLGHASLVMLIFRSRLIPWLMKGLANTGQMAFTNYLMQSIICSLIFYGYGFGNFNKLRFHELYYIVAIIWIFQIIFSVVWLRYFRFGPFEWLWRSLTYWKKQPMKKAVELQPGKVE